MEILCLCNTSPKILFPPTIRSPPRLLQQPRLRLATQSIGLGKWSMKILLTHIGDQGMAKYLAREMLSSASMDRRECVITVCHWSLMMLSTMRRMASSIFHIMHTCESSVQRLPPMQQLHSRLLILSTTGLRFRVPLVITLRGLRVYVQAANHLQSRCNHNRSAW
jgi:hypothetical protein